MKKQNPKRAELVPISDALDGFEKLYVNAVGSREQSEYTTVWAEPQLYLLPFCVPQDRTAERFRQIEITESVTIDGQSKERSFLVNPHPKLGLPGSFELEVMTGIYRIADHYVRETGMVPEVLEIPSLRQFLESIGKTGAGIYMRKLKDALRRLAGTLCISEGFFYSKLRNLYIVDSFTFITSLEIVGETDFNGNTFDITRLKLHEFIRNNLNNNFRTLIDFDFLRSLRTDIAKSLALHLAYRMFKNKGGEWIADYEWLAKRIGIKVYPEIKRAKQQLKEALLELQQRDVIDSWDWLPGPKLRFLAGPYLISLHAKRVAAKDAWIASEQDKARIEKLVTSHPPRTLKEAERQEAFDPLAALCTEFAANGWSASVAQKAKTRELTEPALRAEALKRGHTLRLTTA